MVAVKVIVGALLLGLGRKIYWLFVAAIGFAAGLALATRLLPNQTEWVMLLVALVFGVIGAVLAIFFQRLAISIAGFAAGALIVDALLKSISTSNSVLFYVLLIVGGIIGAVLVSVIFDWALILLSSVAGSLLIVQSLQLTGLVEVAVALVLFLVGLSLQFGLMRREKR